MSPDPLTVKAYTEWAEFFPGPPRTELLEGQIRELPPQSYLHSQLVMALVDALRGAGVPGRLLATSVMLHLAHHAAPEAAVVVLRSVPESAYIQGDHVAIAIDVAAEASPDRVDAYARAGVPEYWVFELAAGRLLRHRIPAIDGTWGEVVSLGETDAAMLEFGGAVRTIPLADVFALARRAK